MCDIVRNLLQKHHEIKLEQYGAVIAAPKLNVFVLSCIHCQGLFYNLELFIHHIKLEHAEGNANISIPTPMDEAICKEDEKKIVQQIIASKKITLFKEEFTEAADIATSYLQHTESPHASTNKSLKDKAFDKLSSIVAVEDDIQCNIEKQKEDWVEIDYMEEEPDESLNKNQREAGNERQQTATNRGVKVLCTARKDPLELEEINSEDKKSLYMFEKQQANAEIVKEFPSTILDKSIAMTTELLNKSNKPEICRSNTPKLYRCTHCSFSTTQSYFLWRHKRDALHSNLPLQSYKCEVCNKVFDIKLKLTLHRKYNFCK